MRQITSIRLDARASGDYDFLRDWLYQRVRGTVRVTVTDVVTAALRLSVERLIDGENSVERTVKQSDWPPGTVGPYPRRDARTRRKAKRQLGNKHINANGCVSDKPQSVDPT